MSFAFRHSLDGGRDGGRRDLDPLLTAPSAGAVTTSRALCYGK